MRRFSFWSQRSIRSLTLWRRTIRVTPCPVKMDPSRPRPSRRSAGRFQTTCRLDWFHNSREDWVLAVEDDASRKVLGMIETDAQSAERGVELLDEVRQEHETDVPIIEVITDHGSEFVNTRRDDRPDLDHAFEGYLAENDIMHTLCKFGRPQSNGKIERFYQTYEKQRWRFDGLDEFIEFYNEIRPHMSLDWDNLETPSDAFDRLLPPPEEDIDDLLATEVGTYE